MQYEKQTGEQSAAMKLKPDIAPHLETYIDAFWQLCGDRLSGMDTPIRFTAVSEFARRFGIGDDDPDQFKRFCEIISTLDGVWMREQNQRARERSQLDQQRQAAWSAENKGEGEIEG